MNTVDSLFIGVIVLFLIILIAFFLKKLGVLKKELSLTFSQIILKVTLPAVVFTSLALREFNTTFLTMSLIMALIELGILFIAWLIATVLKFKRDETGALMLVAAFGMTAFLGYPIIRQAFPGNTLALEEAVITSEIGVGLLLFVLGPFIAMHFGNANKKAKSILSSLKDFFTTPLFMALILGIGFSYLPIQHEGILFTIAFRTLKFIGHANLFLVAFTIGLIFELKWLKKMALFVSIAVLLKLIVKPMLALWFTDIAIFTDMMREIVFIETALPSAILTAVFAKQYDCRPDLVSTAIMAGLVLSLASMSLSFMYFF